MDLEYYKDCPDCGRTWLINEKEEGEEGNIILKPYPHIVCPACGGWIPLF